MQEILAHSRITTTGNVYAHLMMGLKRQAAAGMDAMFNAGHGIVLDDVIAVEDVPTEPEG